jgi:RNA-directed DNA polymerase
LSANLNPSNRPVRIRTPGGVAGERPHKVAPYADSRDVRD